MLDIKVCLSVQSKFFHRLFQRMIFFCWLVTSFFRAPPICLLPNSHYEQIMTAFGGKGYFVQTPEELQKSLRQSLADTTKPSLINVMIEPQATRKAQVCALAKRKAEAHLPSSPQKYLPNGAPCYCTVLSKPFLTWQLNIC